MRTATLLCKKIITSLEATVSSRAKIHKIFIQISANKKRVLHVF